MKFLPLLFTFLTLSSLAQNGPWQLRKNADGIKVYTRTVSGSDLDEFKAVGIVNASPSRLAQHLKEVKDFPTWMPLCAKAELKKQGPDYLIQYQEMDAPFPVSNRDGYYQFNFKADGPNIRVDIKALPDYGPQKEDLVRIPSANGFYYFKDLGQGKSEVTYQMLAGPGGSIPAWLANSTVVNNPFETLRNLQGIFK